MTRKESGFSTTMTGVDRRALTPMPWLMASHDQSLVPQQLAADVGLDEIHPEFGPHGSCQPSSFRPDTFWRSESSIDADGGCGSGGGVERRVGVEHVEWNSRFVPWPSRLLAPAKALVLGDLAVTVRSFRDRSEVVSCIMVSRCRAEGKERFLNKERQCRRQSVRSRPSCLLAPEPAFLNHSRPPGLSNRAHQALTKRKQNVPSKNFSSL